jgi:hypothetical protein
VGSAEATIEDEEDVVGGLLGGVLPVGPTAATTKVEEDIDGGPPGGAAGWSSSVHHQG